LVDAHFAARCFVSYRDFWPEDAVTHVQATVRSIGENTLSLSTGDALPFDVCVVATGRNYDFPFRCQAEGPDNSYLVQQVRLLAEARAQLTAAQRVIVVGGGPTGVETAAEIKAAFPLKPVALLHDKPRLLNREKQVKWRDSSVILRKLQVLGVDVQLNASYEAGGNDAHTYVVRAHGATPNTGLFVDERELDENGLVKTDQFVRVLGRDNVFALGDIVSGYAPNLRSVEQHVRAAGGNVWRLCRGKQVKRSVSSVPKVLASYYVLTLGPNDSWSSGISGMMMAAKKRKDYLAHLQLKRLTGPLAALE
jgi:NADH dehydrogenase FAD-containing subunit